HSPSLFPYTTLFRSIASAVWIYMSIYALFLMCPFVLRSSRRVIALGATLAAVTSAATLVFLLIPAELAFPPPARASEPGATAQRSEEHTSQLQSRSA